MKEIDLVSSEKLELRHTLEVGWTNRQNAPVLEFDGSNGYA